MPPKSGSIHNKPAKDPYTKIPAGAVSYKIRDEELPKLVKIFEEQGKPVRYNKDGTVNKSQFNNLIRDLRMKEYRIEQMDKEKAIKEMEKKYLNKKITKEQLREVGQKVKNGEISMADGKKVALYYYKDKPLELCQELFKHMTKDLSTGEVIPSPKFHYELFEMFQRHRLLALAAPRGHAKSTITTLFWVIFNALYEKKKFIVIVSATEDLAIRFLRDIKIELETNTQLHWMFGRQRSEKWSEKEIMLANGCKIIAKGRGGQMRGLKDRGMRPDLIVLDDLEDSEIVRSEIRRLDLEEWFNGDVLPTLEPATGQLIFIGTILHMDSLLNRALDKSIYPDFTTKRFSAIISKEDGSPQTTGGPDEIEPLWPERFPLEELQKIKQSYITRGQLATFYMEYMNDPVPDEGATFTKEMIQYFDHVPNDPFRSNIVRELFIDLGGGGLKKTADPTAMVVFCTDRSTGQMYVEDYINRRMGTDTDLMISEILRLSSKYGIRRAVIEKTIATNLILASLERELRKHSSTLKIELVSPTHGSSDRRGFMSDGKFQRIAQMESAFKTGEIKIRSWMTDLVEQLLMFPRGQHDDLIDALSYGYMFAKKQKKKSQGKQFRPPTRHGYLNRNYAA